MVLENYEGPPASQLATDFAEAWRALNKSFDDGLALPNLPDEVETRFLNLKLEILRRSRMADNVSEGSWGLHGKVTDLLNTLSSLDYLRQETQILHDNIHNQWHDIYIQSTKMVAVFKEQEASEE